MDESHSIVSAATGHVALHSSLLRLSHIELCLLACGETITDMLSGCHPVWHTIHHIAPGNGNLTINILVAAENIYSGLGQWKQGISKSQMLPHTTTIVVSFY
jgi:hypothetical protein